MGQSVFPASVVKNVQRGTSIVAATNASGLTDITITAVNRNKSFVVAYQMSSVDVNPRFLAHLTSDTNLRLEARNASSPESPFDHTITWEVIEYA